MTMSIAAALAQARSLAFHSDSWRLEGELLLAEACGQQREWLLAHDDEELGLATLTRYQDSLQRRLNGEPLAYILGRKAFWDFDLVVSPAVLIPRPETEVLVEWVLELTRERAKEVLRVADLGTGSGAIAIALARENPDCLLQAVDISADALTLARANAERLGVSNIEFINASWCDGLDQSGYDVIVSNPPYVALADPHLLQDGLDYEPPLALEAGLDGLDSLSTIIAHCGTYLKKDAWLLLEHGYSQRAALQESLTAHGFTNVQSRKDYAGQDRIIAGQAVKERDKQ